MKKTTTKKLLILLACITVMVLVLSACGETAGKTATFVVDGSTFKTVSLNSDGKITEPTEIPVSDNGIFKGWYIDDVTFGTKWDFGTDKATDSIKLYAKLVAPPNNLCTVEFIADGATNVEGKAISASTGAVKTIMVKTNRLASAPGNVLNETQSVTSWYKDAGLTQKWDFSKDRVNLAVLKLYGKWENVPTYKITFNLKGATGSYPDAYAVQGELLTRPATDPTWYGYEFQGWYKDNALTQTWDFATDKVVQNMTLYAKWYLLPTYDLIFNANGGSAVATLSGLPNQTVLTDKKPTDPTKTESLGGGTAKLVFLGWYKEAGLTTAWNWATDKLNGANVTLYAKWDYYSGGTGTSASPYIISNADQLTNLALKVNSGEMYGNRAGLKIYFALAANIDLGGREWVPIGLGSALISENPDVYSGTAFWGSFNGNNYTISNFQINQNISSAWVDPTRPLAYRDYAGLFGAAGYAELKNIKVDTFTININGTSDSTHPQTRVYAGGVIGYQNSASLFDNNSATNGTITVTITSIEQSEVFIGLVAGALISGPIRSGVASGSITANVTHGGPLEECIGLFFGLGYDNSAISGITASGTVNSTTVRQGTAEAYVNVGGLVGCIEESQSNFLITGNIVSSATLTVNMGGTALKGQAQVGGLIGSAYQTGTISSNQVNNVEITANVVASTSTAESRSNAAGTSTLGIARYYATLAIGGIVGLSDKGDITNNIVSGVITGTVSATGQLTAYAGGIAGSSVGRILNNETSASVNLTANIQLANGAQNIAAAGAIAGAAYAGILSTKVTGSDAVLAGERGANNVKTTGYSTSDTDTEYRGVEIIEAYGVNVAFTQGQGISGDPWVLSSAKEIKYLSETSRLNYIYSKYNGNNAPEYIALNVDINYQGEEITPIGSSNAGFFGAFDGRNHTLSNYTITNDWLTDPDNGDKKAHMGFIAAGGFGGTKNLTVTGFVITVTGTFSENTRIYVGGVVGNNDGVLENIAATNGSIVINITKTGTSGNVEAYVGLVAGGDVAYTDSTILAWGNIDITVNSVNGVSAADGEAIEIYAGLMSGYAGRKIITNAIAGSTLQPSTLTVNTTVAAATGYALVHAGGLIGLAHNLSSINNCSVNNVTINNTINASRVQAASGGLVGDLIYGAGQTGTIENSYATNVNVNAVITASVRETAAAWVTLPCESYYEANGAIYSAAAGGLIGHAGGGTITGSYATGTVSVNAKASLRLLAHAGGLIGKSFSTISKSYSTATVTVIAEETGNGTVDSSLISAGGLVGISTDGGSIATSYATGAVSVDFKGSSKVSMGNAAGIAGFSFGTIISNCYSTSNVTARGESTVSGRGFVGGGGITGLAWTGKVENSYSLGNITVTDVANNMSRTAAGGICADIYGAMEVKNSFAAGALNATNIDSVGGAVGADYGDHGEVGARGITGCYYVNGGAGVGGSATTVTNLNNSSFYTTLGWSTSVWDFSGINIGSKIGPILK
ncbi:MAG: InlB B-repeat-containing protein [Clostridiales bacterium]|nr:InlB B-repeat-containing protein [Clostridiales bacterium]